MGVAGPSRLRGDDGGCRTPSVLLNGLERRFRPAGGPPTIHPDDARPPETVNVRGRVVLQLAVVGDTQSQIQDCEVPLLGHVRVLREEEAIWSGKIVFFFLEGQNRAARLALGGILSH